MSAHGNFACAVFICLVSSMTSQGYVMHCMPKKGRLTECGGAALTLPDDCGKAKQATPLPVSQSGATSSSVVHFPQRGVFYVACSVGMHCSAGQHQQIVVE